MEQALPSEFPDEDQSGWISFLGKCLMCPTVHYREIPISCTPQCHCQSQPWACWPWGATPQTNRIPAPCLVVWPARHKKHASIHQLAAKLLPAMGFTWLDEFTRIAVKAGQLP